MLSVEVMGGGGLYPQSFSCIKKLFKGEPFFLMFFLKILLPCICPSSCMQTHMQKICHIDHQSVILAVSVCWVLLPFPAINSICLSLMVLYWMFAGLKAEDSERFKTMVQFECRGLEPIDFQPQVSIHENRVLQCVSHRPRCANNCCIPCRLSAMVLTMLIHWYGLLAYRLVNWMKCY